MQEEKYPDRLADLDSCKHSSVNRMAAGSRLQVQVTDFCSSFTYFPNMLCAVKWRVLGLMAYWYTGSAFHQIPQSYLFIGLGGQHDLIFYCRVPRPFCSLQRKRVRLYARNYCNFWVWPWWTVNTRDRTELRFLIMLPTLPAVPIH